MKSLPSPTVSDAILREVIYVMDPEGPFRLKKGCIEEYFNKICYKIPLLYFVVRRERVLDDIVGIKIIVYGKQSELDTLRKNLQSSFGSPLKWNVVRRYDSNITESGMSIPEGPSKHFVKLCFQFSLLVRSTVFKL